MIPRQHLLSIGAGLVAGAVGALLVGRFAPPLAPSSAPAQLAEEPRAVVVPPGWDGVMGDRVASLEADVARQGAALRDLNRAHAAAPSRGGAGAASDPAAARETERQGHYAKELAQRAELLAAHERETINPKWAETQSQLLEQQLQAFAGEPRPAVDAIDCRSETCIASLRFRSPMDGLAFLQSGRIPVTDSCAGYISTPVPPQDNGEYPLAVIYNCR